MQSRAGPADDSRTFRFVAVVLVWLASACASNTLGKKVDSFLKAEAASWPAYFAGTDLPVNVLYHRFLICRSDCSRELIQSGRYSLAELNNHRGKDILLAALLGLPPSATMVFQEGTFTVQELIEKNVALLFHPTLLEERFGDMERGWLLCALAHYLPASARLINPEGMSTGFLRMMAGVMTNNHFDKFSEAGTHELMGLACAVRKLETEVEKMAPEFEVTLSAARRFLRIKIEKYLSSLDGEGRFTTPFLLEEQNRLLEGLGGPASKNVAIAGHVLTVIGMHYSKMEILKDRRIAKATQRLMEDMTLFSSEVLPLTDLSGKFSEVEYLASVQRGAYAHAWEALAMLRDKLHRP